MPLYRRVPKSGFKNINRVEYTPINLSMLQFLHDNKGVEMVDMEVLVKFGLASKKDLVKVLANGKLTAKMEVKAHAFSKKAAEEIEAQGGNAIKL